MLNKYRLFGIFLSAYAIFIVSTFGELPRVGLPPGNGWTETKFDPCCEKKEVSKYKINPATGRDFDGPEATADYLRFILTHGPHVSVVNNSSSTWSYNCHGYVFDGSGSWILDPANYEGKGKGCYTEDANGPVYCFGAAHSAFAGQNNYPYRSKCAQGPICDHDATVYGTHTARWKPN